MTAERLLAAVEGASAAGEHGPSAALAVEALALWRDAALIDVALPAEADRLEELRLRLFQQRIDAELELGRHDDVAAELRSLVDDHPYRERFVEQLMVALYRSGRHAEALDVYERTRKALADDLGLQPSAELQYLSAQIVRHDPRLARRAAADAASPPHSTGWRSRRATVAALGLAGTVAAVAVAAGGRAWREDDRTPISAPRIALLVPRHPAAGQPDALVAALVDGIRRAERQYVLRTEILVADELDLKAPSAVKAAERVRSGDFDLVVVAGSPLATLLGPAAQALPATRFAVLDGPVDLPNATGFVFDYEQAGYLTGYLSGLMEARTGPRLNGAHVVSTIGGVRGVPGVEELLDGFASGARRALPGITIHRAYSGDFVEQSSCEAIANRHVDAGADIVFAAAGTCSLGALSAAAIRGVWGIGVDGDRSYLGDHILASMEKRLDHVVLLAVRSFVQGTLPGGEDVILGLENDALGLTGISPQVPAAIRQKVAHAAAALRNDTEP